MCQSLGRGGAAGRGLRISPNVGRFYEKNCQLSIWWIEGYDGDMREQKVVSVLLCFALSINVLYLV